jgi:hypothetical protein
LLPVDATARLYFFSSDRAALGVPDNWRNFMRILQAIRGVIVIVLGYISFAVLSSGSDLIVTARSHIADLGGTPPQWLTVKNEPRIVKAIFETLLFGLILLLIWPWVSHVIALTIRRVRLVQNVEKISKRIPKRLIPKDGRWERVEVRINEKLKRFIGRPAEMKFSFDWGGPTGQGQYQWIPVVAADSPMDARSGLSVLLYGYFDGASAKQIERIRTCVKHDQLTVSGVITRADIHKYDDGWRLNIDIHRCTTKD